MKMAENRPTVPAPEAIEEEALLCVQRGEISISEAREAIQRYRDKHGYDWISLLRQARAAWPLGKSHSGTGRRFRARRSPRSLPTSAPNGRNSEEKDSSRLRKVHFGWHYNEKFNTAPRSWARLNTQIW